MRAKSGRMEMKKRLKGHRKKRESVLLVIVTSVPRRHCEEK